MLAGKERFVRKQLKPAQRKREGICRMNLQTLFKTQAELDKKIVEEKGLQGQDLLDKKILALQVELGELANELPEVFKFWANKKNNYEKALKEYVDGLHFILSIGLELGYLFNKIAKQKSRSITLHFNDLFHAAATLYESIESDWDEFDKQESFDELISSFIGLGEMLGFTWTEIEQAYYDKNKVNHERQESGY